MRRGRICRWTRMRRSVARSSDMGPLLLCQSCRGCIIAMPAYNFREPQVHHPRWHAALARRQIAIISFLHTVERRRVGEYVMSVSASEAFLACQRAASRFFATLKSCIGIVALVVAAVAVLTIEADARGRGMGGGGFAGGRAGGARMGGPVRGRGGFAVHSFGGRPFGGAGIGVYFRAVQGWIREPLWYLAK